jgi:hypothetical protein
MSSVSNDDVLRAARGVSLISLLAAIVCTIPCQVKLGELSLSAEAGGVGSFL